MTVFSTSDLPSSVNSLEKLIVWAGTILNELYADTTAIEAVGQATRVAESDQFYITADPTPKWRCIQRQSIPLQPAWRRGNAKIWTFAVDLGSAPIPTEYKS